MVSRLDEETIASRASREFFDGAVVNLGTGIPALCALIPSGERTVFIHVELGLLGVGPPYCADEFDQRDPYLFGAGGQWLREMPGMSCFDHDRSFDMIRGGHIDIAVMGAYQVSEKGDLANWFAYDRGLPSIGGAMDLAVGAKKVIVTMKHTTTKGKPKIVKKCSEPLTARACVKVIITDLAVIEVTKEGLVLTEIAPGNTVEEVQALTEPKLIIAEDLKEYQL
jgi:3-oxoacid CoA-transferase B subunit